ncbi:hypothetical protein PULV_a2557 [Pseudoalteromonas ulvae UL12]|uniref:Peptidase n=1 Tax=Pseudoalteromonas ulvae TaxID=107327 RepID=A0A244CPA4_PSEDV|nr:hypothetical protein [Pseudoalteromonas ulvae]MBE0364265.1 hypothetical protein [Pseudoalteromonas ulvae UL12]OUL57415.1 hypothetical protein B1199_14725 [Pseudoalteromonas ulvae]
MNKRLFKRARTLHKWLGYLLGLQIFFWLLGGLVMSAIPLEMVHGKHLAQREINHSFTADNFPASLDNIIANLGDIRSISYGGVLAKPVYKIETSDGQLIFNAVTGEQLALPSKQEIQQLAELHYLGSGKILKAQLLDEGPREVGYRKDIWQVIFDDAVTTTLYFSKQSGQIITVRSTIWRIFDFFWMLHIMDYEDREDFNNPLLISFSVVAVLFCLSGILMLFQGGLSKRTRLFALFRKVKVRNN